MRPVFLFILLILATPSTFAQESAKSITGLVKDARNEPLPGATVRLFRAVDSTLVRGELTNSTGTFDFKNLRNDMYRLYVTSVGNADYRSGTITIDDQHTVLILPVFIVKPSKTTLNEVTVVAKKPLIEQDINKTIVNVDAMIGSEGSNTLEVLEKTPGVSVSTEGEISLNGKAGVLVLIDGRQTYMSGPDLAAYLKSLPGGSLDKLELMTNPPAKYDAAGSSIINIRLKRTTIQGFTGNVTASYSQGVTSRSNDVVNVNYNHKKINLFGSLGYNKDGNYSDDFSDRRFYDANSSLVSSVQLQNHYQYTSHGVMGRLGMDFAASPNTVYGFVINIQSRPRQDRLDYISRRFNERYVVDSVGTGYTDGQYQWLNTGVNVNIQHKFGNTSRELTADLNYLNYTSRGEQALQNRVNLPDGTLFNRHQFLYRLPSDITIYTAKADYSHPLGNKAKFDAGFKSSVVSNDNDSQYFTQTGLSQTPDYGRSNHFLYRESIHAAYINTRKEWKRLAAQGGFQVENTQINGRQLGNSDVAETSFNRTYTSLFPTVFVSYKLDSTGSNTLTASIARRINRPNYQLLNPFLFYQDQYSFTTGNPYLRPQYHYQYELKYQHKQYVGIGIQYNRFTDVIFQMTEARDDVFITRPDNVARGYILALVSNVSFSPAKWWTVNANVTAARMALNGTVYSEALNPGIYHARVNLLNQFKFNKGWNGELNGFYATKDLAGQRITNPRYRVAAAVQKKVFQDKASIRLTFEDIFHSWQTNDRFVSLKQAESVRTNESDTQRIGLAFTYRFGKETFARKRTHTDNAADAEKGRVD
ncbi:outer membrane beta-barrel family protein [Spirosoma validum]|uniref:Outer membrane beta-barrel protein n=1 Tax=Spirosoma validum TaxID=2771355 RepID=A0A927GDW7_9BACT|nr:outer membrane beta-barrel family protein [Spirosoma validum]MBD2754222.1 outer membrane beta-barrel protein [Spirosoma validum]